MSLLWLACYTNGPFEAGPEVFDDPIDHDDDTWLFSLERINRIDLEVDADAEEILMAQRRTSYPRDEVRAHAVLDGEEVGEVGLRMRGGLGSFQRFDGKPKWELDFNEFSGERFHGLESLSLNNMLHDCTSIRETVASAAYGMVDVPTSRTGYAQLFVNGQDYGIYTVIETQDDRWLKDHFASNDGTFYDGKYQYKDGVVPYFVDFGRGRDAWFDLEEGDEGDRSEIRAISDAVERSEDGMDPALWELVDWELLWRLALVEEAVIEGDGLRNTNNYRVYFQDGLPMAASRWDTDGSFPIVDGEVQTASENDSDGFSLLEICRADETCRTSWRDLEDEVRDALFGGALHEVAVAAAERTEVGGPGDPRRECPGTRQAEALVDYTLTGE
ncbi:MAG: hypothetical protein GY913_10675 [Proteobacteria bacterium]|nr:hypothetical protein [Pseudomonadota bacterium]MCP4917377.1 hypothetical protein [Pseudomonadota bacterium]